MLNIQNIHTRLDSFELDIAELSIDKGEYFVLAGPSGSGKTILLELIAGIYKTRPPGKILLDGKDITHHKMQDRKVGMVFQDNTLFPHLSVLKNIEFAFKHKNQERAKIVERLAGQFRLHDLLARDPKTLSGGEIQRVVLARTLASNPDILLLDEPLSAIDTSQKDQLKILLRQLNRQGQTIIHVTHDFEEAYTLATKMGIMHQGKIVSTGSPQSIYQNPKNNFVARFCGYKNYFEAQTADNKKLCIGKNICLELRGDIAPNSNCKLLIDERKIEFIAQTAKSQQINTFDGIVEDAYNALPGIEYRIDIGIQVIVWENSGTISRPKYHPKDRVQIHFPDDSLRIIMG